jgi:5-methylcytosine-specific restriction endonuclease McrA
MKIPAKVTVKSRVSTITSQFARAKAPYLKPTAEELIERYVLFGMDSTSASCVYCGGEQTEWDHINAVVANNKWTGYFTEINNLIPACGKCNQSRGNKSYAEWMVSDADFSAKSALKKRKNLSEREAYDEAIDKVKLIDSVIQKMPPKKLQVDKPSALEVDYESKRLEITKLLCEAQLIAREIQLAYQLQADKEFCSKSRS